MYHLLLIIIYLAFISLGLPDSVLGAAWPTMYEGMKVPISYAGMLSMIIAFGTIVSSFQSDRLTKKIGTGKLTALSVATTAVALMGFSLSSSFYMLCIWAIPYGLGAGSVDASLNNYIALHYKSRHMSWLHCMWGLGAIIGPYIMGHVLTGGDTWNGGYRTLSIMQLVLTAVLFLTLPLWKKVKFEDAVVEEMKDAPILSLADILRIAGAKPLMTCFFCYCAIEQTAGLWGASYLHLTKGTPADLAATLGSMYFIGITIGRGINGFLAMRMKDVQMVHLGFGVILLGILIMFLPLGETAAIAGLIIIGLGCAPVYPCIIHSTPAHFGADKSQAIIGVQMAFAYMGTCLMPPLFGLIANHISITLFPFYLLLLLLLMYLMFEKMERSCKKNKNIK